MNRLSRFRVAFPLVSAITQSDTDVLPSQPGIHIYAGTLDTYSATASSPAGLRLNWQWMYSLNGGSPVVFQSGSGTVLPVTFTYGAGTAEPEQWPKNGDRLGPL